MPVLLDMTKSDETIIMKIVVISIKEFWIIPIIVLPFLLNTLLHSIPPSIEAFGKLFMIRSLQLFHHCSFDFF